MTGGFTKRSRGDIEAEVSRAVIHFEKEFMGRGPANVRTHVFDDMILVRLKGVLTQAEQKLAQSQNSRSSYLLKQVRNELLEAGRSMLEALLEDIVKAAVVSVHTDISTKTGERIIVITFEDSLEISEADKRTYATRISADVRRVS